MQNSTIKKIKQYSPYAGSSVLLFLGVMGLLIEFSKAKPSSTNLYGYVLGVLFICSGVLTFIAVRRRYGGGLWSFFGLLCIGASIARLAIASQVYLQGRHFISPVTFYTVTATLWGMGCYFLIWGHIRRNQGSQNCHHDAA
jgi:hypothetical protein